MTPTATDRNTIVKWGASNFALLGHGANSIRSHSER